MDKNAVKNAKGLIKQGKSEEVIPLLKKELLSSQYDVSDLKKIGDFLQKNIDIFKTDLKVKVYAQCTAKWLCDVISSYGLINGCVISVKEAEYDNIMQEVLKNDDMEDVAILLPWTLHIKHSNLETNELIENEISFWQNIWNILEQQNKKIIQLGYDYTGCGYEGYHISSVSGYIKTIRELNNKLINTVSKNIYFVDLETISGTIGRNNFYEARNYYWAKFPFSEEGCETLAKYMFNAIRTITTGSKKVLVLDCDNTLWGGVVGEVGAMGIELGENADGQSYREFQSFCKNLSERGVLLAVATKNNPADAKEPFEKNPNMILHLDDIVSFQSGWEAKSIMLQRIAQELNLGINSLVFFDDNPAEREEIKHNLPDVSVIDVPTDSAYYIDAVENSLLFETTAITDDDTKRTSQYKIENKRRDALNSYTNIDDYLASLEMKAEILPINETNINRVVQLIGKTNQFNMTTKRHSLAEVESMLEKDGSIGLCLSLQDKFGDYGLTGVLIAVPEGNNTLLIDTFLLSCRIINRTAEEYFINQFIQKAVDCGINNVKAEYIQTAKNVNFKNLYKNMGFEVLEEKDNKILFEYKNIKNFKMLKTKIK